MRHYIIILLALAPVCGMRAQAVADSLSLTAQASLNKSANENMPYSEFSGQTFCFGLNVGLSQEFAKLWGWQASLAYNLNKSRSVPKCEEAKAYTWSDMEVFGDITFDISDVLRRKRRGGGFNLKIFAGVGGLLSWGYPKDSPLSYIYNYTVKPHADFGMRAGLTASWRVSQRLRVSATLSHMLATDRFNGVRGDAGVFDHRTNLGVGITYNLRGRKSEKTKEVVYSHRLKEAPDLPFYEPSNDGNITFAETDSVANQMDYHLYGDLEGEYATVSQVHTLSRCRRLIYTEPQKLTHYEMYRVAMSYPKDSDGCFDALTIAADVYPNDDIANLNAATVYTMHHHLKDARRRALRVKDKSRVKYLLSVIDAME